MLADPHGCTVEAIRRLGREELIAALVEFNHYEDFQFTPQALQRLSTDLLRTLLSDVHSLIPETVREGV
jgi:hypothetical protein